MNSNLYSNVPSTVQPANDSSADYTVQAFNNHYNVPLELSASVLDAMTGFFTGRGFDQTAAQSIAVILIKQSKNDGYNPMQILDTIGGLDNAEISSLVSEILNYNRFKTSFLGYALAFTLNEQVFKNIIA
jgi:hypothetical protein